MHDLIRLYASEQASHDLSGAIRAQAIQRLNDFYVCSAVNCDHAIDPYRQPVEVPPPVAGCRPINNDIDESSATAWLKAEYACIVSTLAEQTGSIEDQAKTEHTIAIAWDKADNLPKALEHAARCLSLHDHVDDLEAKAEAMNLVGWYSAKSGHYSAARQYCEEALVLVRANHDREAEAEILDSLAYIMLNTGEGELALTYYQQALALCRAISSAYGEVEVLSNLGAAHAANNDPGAARAAWLQALELYRVQDSGTDIDRIERQLANLDHLSAAE